MLEVDDMTIWEDDNFLETMFRVISFWDDLSIEYYVELILVYDVMIREAVDPKLNGFWMLFIVRFKDKHESTNTLPNFNSFDSIILMLHPDLREDAHDINPMLLVLNKYSRDPNYTCRVSLAFAGWFKLILSK